MVRCEKLRKISAYHDGELPPTEATALGEHIRQCPSCQRELKRLQTLSRCLSSLPVPQPPEALLARLRGTIHPRRDRIILRTARALTAVAAAVLVAGCIALWQRSRVDVAPAPLPAAWERPADPPFSPVPPALGGPAQPDMEPGDMETEVDVQIARSVLGGAL